MQVVCNGCCCVNLCPSSWAMVVAVFTCCRLRVISVAVLPVAD